MCPRLCRVRALRPTTNPQWIQNLTLGVALHRRVGRYEVCEVRWKAVGGRTGGVGGRVRRVGDGRADGPGRGWWERIGTVEIDGPGGHGAGGGASAAGVWSRPEGRAVVVIVVVVRQRRRREFQVANAEETPLIRLDVQGEALRGCYHAIRLLQCWATWWVE